MSTETADQLARMATAYQTMATTFAGRPEADYCEQQAEHTLAAHRHQKRTEQHQAT